MISDIVHVFVLCRSAKRGFCRHHHLGQEAIFRHVFPGGGKTVPTLGASGKTKGNQIKKDDLTQDQLAYMEIVRGETCNMAMRVLSSEECLNFMCF